MDNTNNIEELLVRFCEGKVTEEEAVKVRQWIHDSPDNLRMAQRISHLCLAADMAELEKSLDVTRAFRKVSGSRFRKRLKHAGIWLQRIAAILFIPLLGIWLVQTFRPREEAARMVEVRTYPGMSSSHTLPDGTKVWLNSSSSITYPERFAEDIRSVSLKGEAYFEVTKDTERRFVVNAPHDTRIEVLGTHFNLEAYEGTRSVTATLLEGKINFIYMNDGKPKGIGMSPQSKVIYKTDTEEVNVCRTSGISETGWVHGKIILDNTPLEEALHMVGKHYHTDFIIKDPKLKEYSFTGEFSNQSLERILQKFSISSRINWRYVSRDDETAEKAQIEIY